MELFRQTNIDFLGKRGLAVGLSAALIVATIVSLIIHGGPKWGIDFRGGILVYVKFRQKPPVEVIRTSLAARIPGEITVQELPATREVIIGTELRQRDEAALNQIRGIITQTLQERLAQAAGKLDFNNAGQEVLVSRLREPLQRASVALSEQELSGLVKRMLTFRDRDRSGIISDFKELAAVQGVTPAVISVLEQETALAPFNIRQVEIVGAKVGADLRQKTLLATLYALAGMLVYVAFRFEFVAGVAAVVAVIHDVTITVGFFSFFGREITLNVIAALLTLIGYSMNDTIVVYDRIRENLRNRLRGSLAMVVNRSINQTLSRTLLTSGLTLLCVLSLYFLGGAVLNSIAFALFVGIVVGTYSSIFVASAILVTWQEYLERRKKARGSAVAVPVSNVKEASGRRSAKAVK